VSQDTFAALRTSLTGHSPRRATGPGLIEAAVAIVLASGEGGELDLLFIKRAEEEGDPWSGQMALPGGRRDDTLGELDDLAPQNPVLPPVMVRPFVFGLEHRPEVRPSREVALHLWTSLNELPGTAGEATVSVRGFELDRPAYLIGPHVVWGITHRILNGFFDLTT
jgi:hypothetical protein